MEKDVKPPASPEVIRFIPSFKNWGFLARVIKKLERRGKCYHDIF
jgi:hypothetical protein